MMPCRRQSGSGHVIDATLLSSICTSIYCFTHCNHTKHKKCTKMPHSVKSMLSRIWTCYNNNNRFTAFVRDYPGEPVPQETFTHPPSWSSSNLYQLLPSTVIHSILLVQIVWQSFRTTSLHILFEHCACYYLLYPTELHKTAMYDLLKMSSCNVMKYWPYPKYCSYILRLNHTKRTEKNFYMNPGNGIIKAHFGSTSF